MDTGFTYLEGSLLVRLLIAHCLADFMFQSAKGVANKNALIWRSAYLWKHVFSVVVLTGLLVFSIDYWQQILFIGITHLFIDVAKISYLKNSTAPDQNGKQFWAFTVDQLLHLLMIVIAWLWMIEGWNKFGLSSEELFGSYRFQLRILGYLVVAGPVCFLIRFAANRWASDLDKTDSGLADAGLWIGILERVLILTFVYTNQFTAIGFLVAAKSILRLIDRPDPGRFQTNEQYVFSARKHTEYVLIGTFLSYASAIITGLIINWLLRF